jgi:hypothetical protein
MVNQQLLDYIKQQLQQGMNNEQIKQSLLANGWQNTDIQEAFNTIMQVPVQPKKRRWKKIVLIIIGVIIFLIVGLLFLPKILNLFAKDIAPINDSDLKLQKVLVVDKDNAYFDLIKLGNVIYEPKDKSQTILDMVAGKTWDNQFAEEIISRNMQAFEYFAQAAQRPKYQNPESADPANITLNMILTPMNSWRQMARLSAIRALYLAKQSKNKEALDEALNSVNIGQKIQESQATLIEYLVALVMKEVGLETVQKIISSSKLTNAELKQYSQGLDKFYKNENGLITSFKVEYHFQSRAIDSIVSGDTEVLKSVVGEEESRNPEIAKKIKTYYYFQPNKTKLLFAEYARVNIKNANKPCGEIKATEVKPLALTNPAKLYTEENAIGKIIYDVIAINLTGVITKKCQEDLLVGATQAMITIKAYKNDTNNYPASLSELVPSYLSSVPRDPFNGKSLKYSATKKILYSVGEDMQDSGGSIGDDWRKMTDPTFKINF